MYFIYLAILVCVVVKNTCGSPTGGIEATKKIELTGNTLTKVPNQEKRNVGLKERLTLLETATSSVSLGAEKTSGDDLEQELHSRNKRAVRRRGREVAFQATLTEVSATFKMLETITFNNVITNIGSAYNRRTGVFIAPLAGTYMFNTNIVSEKGFYVEAGIVLNGNLIVSAISDHRIPKDGISTWDQGNAAAILRLKKGDKVSVTLLWPQGRHSIHGVGKSSFSGYLLRSHKQQPRQRSRYYLF